MAFATEVMIKTVEALFVADLSRLQSILDRLIERNNACVQNPSHGLLYNGVFYEHSLLPKTKFAKGQPRTMADMSLWGEIQIHLQDALVVSTDRAIISQLLCCMAIRVQELQDIRDVLPDCLLAFCPFSEISSLPRTRSDPTWILVNDPRLATQFKKYLPKMQTYAAMSYMV